MTYDRARDYSYVYEGWYTKRGYYVLRKELKEDKEELPPKF
jgi:hypothetical protein